MQGGFRVGVFYVIINVKIGRLLGKELYFPVHVHYGCVYVCRV